MSIRLFLVLFVICFSIFFLNCSDEDNLATINQPFTGIILFNNQQYWGVDTTATLTLEDKNLTVSTVMVQVKSTSDPAGITIALTGANGSYNGVIKFSTSTSVGDTLKVADGDTITASYQDESPAQTVIDTAIWQAITMSATGVVVLNDSVYIGPQAKIGITLLDSDLSASSVNATAHSSSDPIGVAVVLYGAAGFYTNTISVTGGASSGSALHVVNGDTITVTYQDANPSGSRTDSAVWYDNVPGDIFMDNDLYTVLYAPILVTVIDDDNQNDQVTVIAKTGTDPAGVSLTLDKDGNGRYKGYVIMSFTTTQAGLVYGGLPAVKIKISSGDSITVEYNEPDPADLRMDKAIYMPGLLLPSVNIMTTNYVGYNDNAIIQVADYNHTDPTMTVYIKSSSDPLGISCVLSKTYQDWEISGKGFFGFTSGPSGTGKIQVTDGDTITATYTDFLGHTVSDMATWHAE
jgi:hypothetical protein